MGSYALPGAANEPMATWLNSHLDAEAPIANPGLLLDRLVPAGDFDQKGTQYPHLDRVVKSMANAESQTEEMLADWDLMVHAVGGEKCAWSQTTVWHMALHLSRAIALENASLCLHPVYGFPFIPGTGLKGLARSSAQLCDGRNDRDRDLLRIFGKLGGTGSVVFLDAWPAEWPEIKVDIVNNHHKDYYSSKGETPPGDWESPNPVYFLVVAPGVKFKFAVVATTPRTSDDDLDMARDWLQSGLQDLGAGAKTAAGYGYFSAPEDAAIQEPPPSDMPAELTDYHAWLMDWLAKNPTMQNIGDPKSNIMKQPEDLHGAAAQLTIDVMQDEPLLDERPLRPKKDGTPKLTLRERMQELLGDA